MHTAPTSCYRNNILIKSWHPLGKLKSLLHSLEEWKLESLYLVFSNLSDLLKILEARNGIVYLMALNAHRFQVVCTSWRKARDHHLSILWSPPKSAWEVVEPNCSNVPPFFTSLFSLIFKRSNFLLVVHNFKLLSKNCMFCFQFAALTATLKAAWN